MAIDVARLLTSPPRIDLALVVVKKTSDSPVHVRRAALGYDVDVILDLDAVESRRR
jgi:hypothetical protein